MDRDFHDISSFQQFPIFASDRFEPIDPGEHLET